jgi:hypothetical protein
MSEHLQVALPLFSVWQQLNKTKSVFTAEKFEAAK